MPSIFLAPESGEHSHKNFITTIIGGVDPELVNPLLTQDNREILKNSQVLFVWGNKESLKSRWESMQPGDIILFYTKGNFVAYGKLLTKQYSEAISDKLWPRVNGLGWPCIFFIHGIKNIHIPIQVFRVMAGYKQGWDRVQGFMQFKQHGVNKIIESYGSVENFLNSSDQSLLEDTIIKLNEDLAEILDDPKECKPQLAVKRELYHIQNNHFEKTYSLDERKLGKANRTHQMLVNTFIEYLNAFEPKEDRKSFDLLVKIKEKFFLFEMKSTGDIKSQIRAAIGQLLSYEFFLIRPMATENEPIIKCLVLDVKPPKKYIQLLDHLGIHIFWVTDSTIHGPTEMLEYK